LGPPISNTFYKNFTSINGFDNNSFREWLLVPGMLFSNEEKWWGGEERRVTPHEGIDLIYYRDGGTVTAWLGPETKIPCLFPGTVATICADFLGTSVFIIHRKYQNEKAVMFTAFGHTKPAPEIQTGTVLEEGDVIGSVADTRGGRHKVPCHLHISVGWIPDSLSFNDLNWKTVSNPKSGIVLVNPLPLLGMPYSIIRSIDTI
jgi:hypothetical protein